MQGDAMKYLYVFLALLILVGCSGKEAVKDKDTFPYTCDDGTEFTVKFDKVQDNMTFTMDGRARTLKHLISGSGTRYGDGELTYWGKGDTAMLIRGADITNCRVTEK
jgi:membrane-bound inhibitor of C-type lysozyme